MTHDASRARLARFRAAMLRRGVVQAVLLHPATITYLTGFTALLYSRAIILMITQERTTLIVPGLEEEHARQKAAVDEMLVYYEHPERGTRGENAYDMLLTALDGGVVGLEYSTAPLALAERLRAQGIQIADIGGEILRMRLVKDPDEIERIRVAGQIAQVGVDVTLRESRPGVSQLAAETRGTQAMLERAAEIVPSATLVLLTFTTSGPETSLPHLITTPRRFTAPDLVIHSRQVSVDGYRAELERTYFIGEPTAEQRRLFAVMQAAQWAAIEACRPGTPMSAVDAAARRIIQEAGFGERAIHRTGHGLGIEAHEPPYLRWDVDDPLEPGMVVSIEPGFYLEGLAGYRHSDTVLVTEDGYELLTDYPRDLEAMILPAG